MVLVCVAALRSVGLCYLSDSVVYCLLSGEFITFFIVAFAVEL